MSRTARSYAWFVKPVTRCHVTFGLALARIETVPEPESHVAQQTVDASISPSRTWRC